MKASYARIAINLLVMALLVAGLAGCERRAEEREVETSEALATPAPTQESERQTPVPGETVVSAVTPTQAAMGTVAVVTQPPSAATSTPVVQATPLPTQQAPAPTQPPPPSGQDGGVVWHTVQRGETLAAIGRRYGTTWQAISQANGLVNPNQIYVGQKLKIPSGSAGSSPPSSGATGCRIRHTVKSGEWVWQIARNYGVSPYDILAANDLTVESANTIYAGKVLCIP